jgi:hypothetical protein
MFPISIVAKCKQYAGSLPRRDLFRGGSFLALSSLLSRQTNAAPVPSTGGLRADCGWTGHLRIHRSSSVHLRDRHTDGQ